jgi:hypothetical protein
MTSKVTCANKSGTGFPVANMKHSVPISTSVTDD